MRRSRLLFVGVVIAALLAAGCGSKGSTTTSNQPDGNRRFAKTRFLLHAGLGFGAFHRYIYKPYREGSFHAGAPGRTKAMVKAGAAAAFAYHEFNQAAEFARADPTLSRMVAPLTNLGTTLQGLEGRLKSGTNLRPGELDSVNGQLDKINQESTKSGAPIKDRDVPALS